MARATSTVRSVWWTLVAGDQGAVLLRRVEPTTHTTLQATCALLKHDRTEADNSAQAPQALELQITLRRPHNSRQTINAERDEEVKLRSRSDQAKPQRSQAAAKGSLCSQKQISGKARSDPGKAAAIPGKAAAISGKAAAVSGKVGFEVLNQCEFPWCGPVACVAVSRVVSLLLDEPTEVVERGADFLTVGHRHCFSAVGDGESTWYTVVF
jgi:hypothetical protein